MILDYVFVMTTIIYLITAVFVLAVLVCSFSLNVLILSLFFLLIFLKECDPVTTCHEHGNCNPEGFCECNFGFEHSSNCSSCAPNHVLYPSCMFLKIYILLLLFYFSNKCSGDVANCSVNNGQCDYRTLCFYDGDQRNCSVCPHGTNGTGYTRCDCMLKNFIYFCYNINFSILLLFIYCY